MTMNIGETETPIWSHQAPISIHVLVPPKSLFCSIKFNLNKIIVLAFCPPKFCFKFFWSPKIIFCRWFNLSRLTRFWGDQSDHLFVMGGTQLRARGNGFPCGVLLKCLPIKQSDTVLIKVRKALLPWYDRVRMWQLQEEEEASCREDSLGVGLTLRMRNFRASILDNLHLYCNTHYSRLLLHFFKSHWNHS